MSEAGGPGNRRSGTRHARAILSVFLVSLLASAFPATAVHGDPHVSAAFTPTLNADGWATADVSVSLTCTPAREGCEVEYSLDQGPTQRITPPSPFTVSQEGAHTISARAIVPLSQTEAPAPDTFAVKVDKTAPVPPSLACTPAVSGWCLSRATLTAATDTPSGVLSQLCYVGETAVACTAGALAQEGEFTFNASARDVAGNAAERQAASFKVDSVAPLLTLTPTCASLSGTGWCLEAPLGWSMSATDPSPGSGLAQAGPTCKINGNAVACSSTGQTSLTTPGSYLFALDATDVAGNANATTKTQGLDLAPPTATLTSSCTTAGDDGWCRGGFQLQSSMSDDSGVTPTRVCDVDGSVVACNTLVNCEVCSIPQGAHTARVSVTDAAGRVTTASLAYKLDTAAPVAPTLACTAAASTWCLSAALLTAASDAGSGIASQECFVNGAPIACTAGAFPTTGTFTFRATARDAAGHTSEFALATFKVDLDAPTVTLTPSASSGPGADGWYLVPVTVTLASADGTSGVARTEWSLDTGRRWTTGTSFTVPHGDHFLYGRVTDNAGRVTTSVLRVRADIVANPRVLADSEMTMRPFDDPGVTRIVFQFSEPMDRTSTEAALTGATGWTRTWGSDDMWLNFTRTDVAAGATGLSITIGTGAQGRHGGALTSAATRTTVGRGPQTYYVTDSTQPGGPAYNYVNLTTTGTQATSAYCDDCGQWVSLPFPFTFYGTTYTSATISSNGFLSFTGSCASDYTPQQFPEVGHCAKIAGFWEDLDPRPALQGGPDRIFYATQGTAPNRVFIVSWSIVHHYSYANPIVTFEVKLFEGTNDIEVHYETVDTDSSNSYAQAHLLGIADPAGTRHLTYAWGDIGFSQRAVRYSTTPSAIDTTPPVVTISLSPADPTGANGWYNAPVTATIGATDVGGSGVNAATIAYSFDGATWTPGTSVVLPQGATTLQARASDVAGNLGTASQLVRFDNVAPTVVAGGAGGAQSSRSATVFFNFSEPMDTASVIAALTGATGWTATWNATNTGLELSNASLADNATILTLGTTARDLAGNALAQGASRRIFREDPPTVVASGTTGVILGTSAEIVFTFSTAMNTTSVNESLTGATYWTRTWNSANRVLTLTNDSLPLGAQTINVSTDAKSVEGSHLLASVNRSFVREENPPPPPPPPRADPPDAPTNLVATLNGTNVRLSWNPPTQDRGAPVTGYKIFRDSILVGETSALAYDLGALGRGRTYTLAVRAVNSAGDGLDATTSVSILPRSNMSVVPVPSSGWYRVAPLVTLSADPSNAAIKYDLGAGEINYTTPFALPTGEPTLRWRSTAGGLVEPEQSASFRVDPVPPRLTGASVAPASILVNDSVLLSVSANDSLSGVAGVTAILTPASGPTLRFPLVRGAGDLYTARVTPPVGNYTVGFVANDTAGNEGTTSAGALVVAAPPPPPPVEEKKVEKPAEEKPLEPASVPPGGGGIVGGPVAETPQNHPAPAAPAEEQKQPQQPTQTEPTKEPEKAPPPPPPRIVIRQPEGENAPLDAGARGVITIDLEGLDDLSRVYVVLIDERGGEAILSREERRTEWDTTTANDGRYTIEVRREARPLAAGEVAIQSSHPETLASLSFLVVNPDVTAATATVAIVGGTAAVVVTQTALSAAAAGAGSSAASSGAGAGSSLLSRLDIFGFFQEVAFDTSEDRLKDKTKERAAVDRKRRVRSTVAAAVSLAILAGFWALGEAENWTLQEWLLALPIVGVASVLVMAQKYITESSLAWFTHARPRIRLWVAGVIALALSVLIFRSPFGYPGYVDEYDQSKRPDQKRINGYRGLATIASANAFTLPFLVVAPWLPWQFVSVGLLIAVTNAATSCMPFAPLPAHDVWKWKKWPAILVALVGFGLYVAYVAALLPLAGLWAIALVGTGIYVGSMIYFRRSLGPRPAPATHLPVSVPIPVLTEDAPPAATASTIVAADAPIAVAGSEPPAEPSTTDLGGEPLVSLRPPDEGTGRTRRPKKNHRPRRR